MSRLSRKTSVASSKDPAAELVAEGGAYVVRPHRHPAKQALRRYLKRLPGATRLYLELTRWRHETRVLVRSFRWRPWHVATTWPAPWQAQISSGLFVKWNDATMLESEFTRLGLSYESDADGINVPSQTGIEHLFGDWVKIYPPNALYRFVIDCPSLPGRARLRLLAGNVLLASGLGPRLYDVLCYELANQSLTVFVMDNHAVNASSSEAAIVLHAIRKLVDDGLIREDTTRAWSPGTVRRLETATAMAPSRDGVSAQVAEPERFTVVDQDTVVGDALRESARQDLHFGDEVAVRGSRYLYQSVPTAKAPGRRETSSRWAVITKLLAESGHTVADRLVFDVGCNAGMMLGAALSDGARWGFGWDRRPVTDRARKLLLALGYTRFDLFGVDLQPTYPLAEDVPSHLSGLECEHVLLYLAIRHHVGFLDALKELPWGIMIYEGGESESVSTLERSLAQLDSICQYEICAAGDFRDGDSDPRPVAVIRRVREFKNRAGHA